MGDLVSGRKIGRPRIHPEPGPDLASVKPLAAAQHRRLSQIQHAAYRRKWAPVVAALVAPFITPPKPKPAPPPEPPKPHVYPPWVRITPRRVFVCPPDDDEPSRPLPLPRPPRPRPQGFYASTVNERGRYY